MNGNNGCVLLAGGRGIRMNSINKAFLEYRGETFAGRIEDELTALRKPCYISCAHYEQLIPAGWRSVSDDGSRGPLGGIYACLIQAEADGLDGLFFAPCDAPLFSRRIIELMPMKPDTDAVVWRTADGRLQVTFGWYSVRCIPAIRDNLRNKSCSIRELIRIVRTTVLETGEYGLADHYFANINTPEEYESLSSSTDPGKEAGI